MIRAAFAAFALASSIARAESWLYRLDLDAAAPLAAQVAVELPAARRAQDFSVQVRGTAINVRPQVQNVRCDGVPVAPDSAGAWRVQGRTCARLSWTLQLPALPETGIDVRAQPSLYAARERIWLIAEASALLRPVGDLLHRGEIEFSNGGTVHTGERGSQPQRRVVPSLAGSPGFYAVGAGPVSIVREGDADLIYVNLLGVSLRDLFGQHRRQLGYLMRAAGFRPSKLFRTAVIWLPAAIEGDASHIAGGHRTILAGGAVREDRLLQPESMLLSQLHEQFQQFAPADLPLWVRASVAQYYAVKALRRTNLPSDAVAAAERRTVDPLRAPTLKLREAQRRVLAGELGAMASLHVAGATFWDRVDRAIVRKSGFRTLDSVLPQLLAADWRDDRLPPSLEERLRRYAGDAAIDDLLERYVGP